MRKGRVTLVEDRPSTKLPKRALVYDVRQRLFYRKGKFCC